MCIWLLNFSLSSAEIQLTIEGLNFYGQACEWLFVCRQHCEFQSNRFNPVALWFSGAEYSDMFDTLKQPTSPQTFPSLSFTHHLSQAKHGSVLSERRERLVCIARWKNQSWISSCPETISLHSWPDTKAKAINTLMLHIGLCFTQLADRKIIHIFSHDPNQQFHNQY